MTQATRSIRTIQAFWDSHPCGHDLSDSQERREYFAEIAHRRYSHEPHIRAVARFSDFAGKRVLEIGNGMGTDGLQFQQNGADYFGVDLTFAGQQLAREQFSLSGPRAQLTVADAEHLPMADESFDHVYSLGVIHHSPSTESIVDEMFRVLRPGGTFCVMVYNKASINYHVEIMFLRKLFRRLLYPKFMPGLLAAILRFDRAKLEKHRELLISRGRISKQDWISMNTDGPDCPLAKVYGKADVLDLFAKFQDVTTEVWFFDRSHWSFVGKAMPDAMANFLGRRWGWHRMVYGRKPPA